ncbi:CRISPR-associated helicase Cas3' [Spongiactinospora sp. 9N601]|uniref:CRISPR-associated helicase Cas3' n=1 Tax=Spongiactinospora sp. 9N601 TaxID=3375149 RepID=UPI0037A7FFDF
MTPASSAPWAKATGDRYHPLVCHVLDTAAVAERLIGKLLGPQCFAELRAGFEPLGNPDGWIATLCGLHDLGKYSPAFQGLKADLAADHFPERAAADVKAVRKPAGLKQRVDTPHGLLTAMHLKDMLLRWGATQETAEVIAVALGGHHGYFPDGSALRQARREINHHGGPAWEGWRDSFVKDIVALRGLPLDAAWEKVHMSAAAAVGFAALASVSDWIASDTGNFPYADAPDPATYASEAQRLATEAVRRLELHPWTPPTTFAELFPADSPRPVQALAEHITADRDEPALIIIEAPTGEGKSKAGLQTAAALVHRLNLIGAYVAMPTQATSNQMLTEVQDLQKRLGDNRTIVQLIHSAANEYPTDVGRDDPDDSDVQAQEWFTRKKSLLTPLGVGTVDQAMKGAIRSGHFFVLLAALSGKVVVIDEVHAYDTYMSTILDRLLAWLGRLGTSVVMLSATLPASRREELIRAWQSGLLRNLPRETPDPEPHPGYPRVTVAGKGSVLSMDTALSDLNAGRRVRLAHVPDEDIADWALDRAADSGCVAIVHNLVRRAEATYTALEERIAALPPGERPRLIAINGPMPTGERKAVEADLRAFFGKNGTRPRAIVVATQVLEHGLDLDFDAMLSDLSPIDRLIQRAGRLHRFSRRGEPVLAIAGVEDTDAGPRFPAYLDRIYAPMTLMRTWALLRERTALEPAAEVTELIDAVYGPDEAIPCPTGWEESWRTAAEKLTRERQKNERDGRVMYLPHPIAVTHLGELTRHGKSARQTRQQKGGKRGGVS